MKLIELIKHARENTKGNKINFASVTLDSKDINGGIGDFIEKDRRFDLVDGSWRMRIVEEKTVQPSFGQTITTTLNEDKTILSDEGLSEYLIDNTRVLRNFLDEFNFISVEI